MTMQEISFHRPEVIANFSVIFCFVCRYRPFRVPFRHRVNSRTPSLPNNFAVPSAIGNFKCSPFLGVITSMDFRRVQIFQLLNVCNQNSSFPNSARDQHPCAEFVFAKKNGRNVKHSNALQNSGSKKTDFVCNEENMFVIFRIYNFVIWTSRWKMTSSGVGLS